MKLFRKKEQKQTKEEPRKTYWKGIQCGNCGQYDTYDISLKMLVKDFVVKTRCSWCECYLDGIKRERKRAGKRGSVQ